MELNNGFPLFNNCVPRLLTLFTLHCGVVADFFEADVSQVEHACHDLQHQRLLLREDPDHVHRVLGAGKEITHMSRSPT